MSESNGLRSTIQHEYMQMFGDVVVGKYNEQGVKIKPATATFSQEELAKRQDMYASHALHSGGSTAPIAPVGSKKPKKITKKALKTQISPTVEYTPINELQTTYVEPVSPVVVRKHSVFLHNKMGRIKLQVEAVLESEMAHCLVFANEDDVIFTPNAGETLNFTNVAGDTSSVYYADTLFNWTDGNKKLMILFKSDEQ